MLVFSLPVCSGAVTLYIHYRQQTVFESECHELTTLSQFSMSSLLHAGRRECRQQTDFQLPYNLHWLKQHGMVNKLQFCCVSSSNTNSICCCLITSNFSSGIVVVVVVVVVAVAW